jgi:hypothetical protein
LSRLGDAEEGQWQNAQLLSRRLRAVGFSSLVAGPIAVVGRRDSSTSRDQRRRTGITPASEGALLLAGSVGCQPFWWNPGGTSAVCLGSLG